MSTIENRFQNGFESWQETHFEVVTYINKTVDIEGSIANIRQHEQGTGGLYELASELTDDFEYEHAAIEWNGDFFDSLHEWLTNKEQQ